MLIKGFNFQPNGYNRFHDSLMMSMNLTDIANLNIKVIIAVLLAELGEMKP